MVKIALEYRNAYLNILDLIQEGNLGLVQAAKKFNPYKGTRFSTYSSFYIRACILKHIMDTWSLVKLGTNQGERKLFYRLKREKKKLEDVGALPAPQLIADVLGVEAGEVENIEKRLNNRDVSLDCPMREGEQGTFIDTIGSGDNIEEIVADRETKRILERKIMDFRTLNEREAFIFDRRIMAENRLTLEDISRRFGISREWVRQVERMVLEKLGDKLRQEFTVEDVRSGVK